MKTKVIKILIFLLLFSAIVFTLYRMVNRADKNVEDDFVQAKYRDIKTVLTFSGNIEPEKEIEIKSTISGILEKLMVREGDVVHIGQPIARITFVKDPMEYKQVLKQLEVARLRLENAKQKFQKTQVLYQKHFVSQQEYENEKLELNILYSEYQSVLTEMNMLRGIYSQKDLSNIITATGDGTILNLPVKEGGSVMARGTLSEGTTIARVADMNSLVFKGNVSETDILKLREGTSLKISLSADDTLVYDGKIENISPKGYIQDGTCRFQITSSIKIPAEERRLVRAGCTANATAILKKKKNVLALEEKYFNYVYDSVYVNILKKDGMFERRFLKVGISDGIFTEIVSGLTQNDKIKKNNDTIGDK